MVCLFALFVSLCPWFVKEIHSRVSQTDVQKICADVEQGAESDLQRCEAFRSMSTTRKDNVRSHYLMRVMRAAI